MRVAAALIALAVPALALPAAANAEYTSLGSFAGPGSGAGELDAPRGAAVDEAGSRLFVADSGNDRVQIFDLSGGTGTYAGEIADAALDAPRSVAIDGDDGSIYVADADDVLKFDSALAPVGGFSSPGVTGPLAVDPSSGELLVGDVGTDVIRRYASDGTAIPASSVDGSTSPGGAFTDILDLAVNSAGSVYVVDASGDITDGSGASRVERFSGPGAHQATLLSGGQYATVTTHPSNDLVVVSGRQNAVFNDLAPTLHFFGPDDGPVEDFALASQPPCSVGSNAPLCSSVQGLAFDGVSNRLYVVTDHGYYFGTPYGAPSVQVYREAFVPVLSIDPVDPSSITGTEAVVTGTVNPNGQPTTWQIEYRMVGGGTWESTDGEHAGNGTDPVQIEGTLPGLTPSTEYEVRLRAENSDGAASSSVETFTTPQSAPAVSSTFSSNVQSTSASLNGGVNPYSLDSEYWFEYGTSDCSSNPCNSLPAVDAGDGSETVPVAKRVTGLLPGTIYYFRAVAENSAGRAEGPIRTFETPASGAPTYTHEMVSPPDKNGGAVSWDPAFLAGGAALSPDGERMTYTSRIAFAGAVGNPITSTYLGTRGQDAWVNHTVTPPVASGSQLYPPSQAQVGNLSEDLTKALVQTNVDPETHERTERYDVYFRDFSTDDYRRMTPDPAPGGSPYTVGTVTQDIPDWTPSLGHFVFTTTGELTPDAVGVSGRKAYVIDTATGTPILASVLGGAPGSPTELGGDLLVSGAANQNVLSDDGSKLIFMDPSGDLHQRNVESGETLDLPGRFLDASSDGRFIFLRTTDQLTPEDANSGSDIYRYDTTAAGGDPILVSEDQAAGDGSGGGADVTVATTETGDRVYFTMDSQQLVDGAPGGTSAKLYLWDEADGVSFVADYTPVSGENWATGNKTRLSAIDISDDGSTLAVLSRANLTPPQRTALAPGEFFPSAQVYVYDADDSTATDPDLRCVSCLPGPGDTPYVADFDHDQGFGMFRADSRDYVTDDGRVVFQSTAPLLAADTNGSNMDVYTYRDDQLDLISSGRHNRDSYLFGASASGTIAFVTAEQLSAWDEDAAYDAYVARVGSGLPEPPVPPPPCVGDDCQGLPTLPPADDELGSDEPSPGNPTRSESDQTCERLESSALRKLVKSEKKRNTAKQKRAVAKRSSGGKAKKLRKQARRLKKQAKSLRADARELDERARKCRTEAGDDK